jgi:hypothetical protein
MLFSRVFRALSPALALALVLTACVGNGLPRANVRLASQHEHEVVAAVVENLRHNADCSSAEGSDGVAVNRYMISARDLASDEWLKYVLGAEDWSEIAPLLPNLRTRGVEERIMDWRLPESSQIRNRDLSALNGRERSELEASVRCFATFMQPVFSDDASRALVALHVGPSPHGALAIYALKRSASGWYIARRRSIDFI